VIAIDPLGLQKGKDSLPADSAEIAAAHRMQNEYQTTMPIALNQTLTDMILKTQLSTLLVDGNGTVLFGGGGVEAAALRPLIESLIGSPIVRPHAAANAPTTGRAVFVPQS